jgi:transposase
MLSIFCISRSTFYEWRKLHLNNKINDINLRSKYISTKINYDIKQYIIKYVLKKAFINTILIKNNIRRKFGINISTSSIYLLLKTNKITYKKTQKKFCPYSIAKIKKLKRDLFKQLNKYNYDDIFSIDETSIDIYTNPDYGWNIAGKPVIRINKKNCYRYTMITIISNNKMIAYKLIRGSANGETFKDFINETIINKYDNKALLMDNARIHHYGKLRELVNASTNKIIYNVPYNPETNPIELLFAFIKPKIKKQINGTKTITNIINSISKQIKPKLLNSFYKKSLTDQTFNTN